MTGADQTRASLYNRHRPARLDDLMGQDHVARALRNALTTGRVSRGYLFSGPRGTGKTTTARILARCLNCQSSTVPTPAPCGTCDSCRRTGHDDWLDVVEVDAASSARRIDEMRDWIESVRYLPAACRFRVTIMDEAHQIQKEAESALLKTLEEPPPHLVVILCTTHPWEIMPTIRSRLQHFQLRRPSVANLRRVLERVAVAEGIETHESALDLVARAGDGSYRDALGLLDQVATFAGGRVEVGDVVALLGTVERETLMELAELTAAGDGAGALELLATSLDGGADPEQLMSGLVGHLRLVCLLQQGVQPREDWAVGAEELDRLRAQANQLAPSQVVRALDLFADAAVRVHHGQADPRLQVELAVAKLARPALEPGLHSLAVRIERLERDGAMSTAPGAPAPAAPLRVAPAPSTAVDPPAPDLEPVPADHEHLARLWPQALAALERDAPPVFSFLSGARLAAVDGEGVDLAVAGRLQADMLGSPDHRARVEAALARVTGRRLTVRFIVEDAPVPHPGPAPDEPIDHRRLAEEIKSVFKAEEVP